MKIEFDEATIEAAVNARIEAEAYGDGAAKFFARFYADAANRQLEAMEKPVFEVGKTYLNGEGRKWKIFSYCADEPGYDMAVLSDKGIKCSFMANGQRWKVGPIKYYDLLPGAIEESGQAGVSPPLVEGGSPALTDEEIGKELADTFRRVPVFTWTAVGRRARELLVPQGNVVIDDNFVCRPAYDEMQSRAEKAEADKAKAEAALEQLRDFAECLLNETSEQVASPGYYSGVRSAVEIAGFTIIPAIPAQPLKVLRHD